ncbi:MAG: glycerol-3-phosphate dehydrogenase [Gemmataceae bacterium]|nr:glycerol-3-phosphate dehydrogenase [Gemmataceae bacterium]
MKRDVDALAEQTFDLLILGGGITGAGVALDAAARGLLVALIDKGDFASGTSSASSKLIHGGLRYLEHGAFPLVYEALHERTRLLRNAPHLVRPLRFVLPFYAGARLAPWQWRAGLTLYDLLAGRGNLRRSRPLTARRLLAEFPGLRANGLLGGTEFFDAQMDDARLCIEVVRTAAVRGAQVANYVEAVGFERQGSVIVGVQAVDQVSGSELTIQARQVLNATGPWVDAVCALAGEDGPPRLEPTKGVHLLAPGRGLAAAFLLLHPRDGRILFVIPWLGKTLIGTTDTVTPAGPDELTVLPEEVAYLLEAHNHHFEPPLTEADLLGTFAGLRPLIRARPGEPSARSREFRIFEGRGGLLSVAGGKYTTYRSMAETITDLVAGRLGVRRPGRTATLPLDGTPPGRWDLFARSAVAELGRRHGLGEEAARHLVGRYGRRAEDVAHYLQHFPRLARPVVEGEPDLQAELMYQRDQEMALRPEDYLLRRTRLGLFHPELLAKFA